MSFSAGGTQSGTDTNLSGLTGVTGTTTFAIPSGITVYQVSSTLTINGTLSWNPNTEWLWSVTADGSRHIAINSGGSLTVDGTLTNSNGTYYELNPALLFTGSRDLLYPDGSTADILVNSGGTLTLTGIRIQIASHMSLFGSGTNIQKCRIEGDDNSTNSATNSRIRNSGAITLIDNVFNGIQIDNFVSTFTLSRCTWDSTLGAIECISGGSGGSNGQYTVSGFFVGSAVYAISNWHRARVTAQNLRQNYLLNAFHLSQSGGSTVANGSATKVVNALALTVINNGGTGLNTPSVFMRDVNNGGRFSVNYNSGAPDNFTPDNTYYVQGNSSGVFPNLDILCYVVAGGRSGLAPVYDYRSRSNSVANTFDFIIAHYGSLPLRTGIDVFGVEGAARAVSQVLLTDTKITQATRATVAAYTSGQSTFSTDKLYDYSAYDKTLSTGIEQPSNTATRWAEDAGISVLISSAYELIINSALTGISVNHSTRKISISPLAAGTTFPGGLRLTNVELVDTDTQNVPVSVLSGGVIKVADGTSNLVAWGALSGVTINLRSGATAATVTVASTTGITAGAGVTLAAPAINFTASEIVTATFNNVRCRLSLTPGAAPVNLADDGTVLSGGLNFTTGNVNTTTHVIALTGIAGKLNSNSVIRFFGTDLPAPIDTRAVYYPSTDYAGTNSLKISGSIGGAALDLTDVGSGSDMYCSIWTELSIALVTSGDYIVNLTTAATAAGVTLANGDILVLQAIHHDPPGTGGSSVISDYLEDVFQYSGSSIVALATLTRASQVMTLLAELGLDGSQVTGYTFDADTPGKVQVDVNKPVIDSKELLAFYYYVHWVAAGLKKLRGNVIVENLNSIAITGILTIDSDGRSVMGGPFTYRKDGKNIIADESDQVSFNWESTRAAVVIQEVAYNLAPEMQLLLESTAAMMAQVANASSGLTAQQVRDSLKLAPTAGSSAAGSVDADLDALTATIGAAGAGLTAIPNSVGVTTLLSRIGGALTITGGAVTVGTISTDAVSAGAISAAAVTKIQSGLSTLTQQQVTNASLLNPIGSIQTNSLYNAVQATFDTTIESIDYTRPMAKQLGLVVGVTATHTPTAITVSDADGSTTITDNGGGSYTVQKVP